MYKEAGPLTDNFTEGTATIKIETKKLVEREKENCPSSEFLQRDSRLTRYQGIKGNGVRGPGELQGGIIRLGFIVAHLAPTFCLTIDSRHHI